MNTELSIRPSMVYSILEALELRSDCALSVSRDPVATSIRFEAELTGIQIIVESASCTPAAFCNDARKELMLVIRGLQSRLIDKAYRQALQLETVKRSRSVPQSLYATAGAVS